jgi:hypothetical protein
MSDKHNPQMDRDEPVTYQIRVKGHLAAHWEEWYGDITITLEEDGSTLLTGTVADQAALHGLLRKVRDLGLILLSVRLVQPGQSDDQNVES